MQNFGLKKVLIVIRTEIFLTFPDRYLGKEIPGYKRIYNNQQQQQCISYSSFVISSWMLISPVRQFPCRLTVSETSLAAQIKPRNVERSCRSYRKFEPRGSRRGHYCGIVIGKIRAKMFQALRHRHSFSMEQFSSRK